MNWTQIEGKWDQLKGEAKSKWGKLTDDDLKAVGGKFDSLIGKVVERYGLGKEQARDQVIAWADRLHERIDDLGHRSPESSDRPAKEPRRS